MEYKIFTKSMITLITVVLIVTAFTRENTRDWLMIGVFSTWIFYLAVSLAKNVTKKNHQKDDDCPDEEANETDDENEPDTENDPFKDFNIQNWYKLIGHNIITDIVTEQNTRGHRTLTITETGDITINEEKVEEIDSFPAKTYWDELSDLIYDDGLEVSIDDNTMILQW